MSDLSQQVQGTKAAREYTSATLFQLARNEARRQAERVGRLWRQVTWTVIVLPYEAGVGGTRLLVEWQERGALGWEDCSSKVGL